MRRCFIKPLLHILCGSFLPITVEEWGAKFVQFQGKSFSLFPLKRPLLQNCIMHSSKCTNGYFWRFSSISSLGARLERPILYQWHDSTGAGLDFSLSAVTNVLFSPLTQTNYCWMDTTTSKFIMYFLSSFLIYKWKSQASSYKVE